MTMAEYIDRKSALEICETEQERLRMLDYCGYTVAWNIGHAIKAIPTVDAVPVVHGRWIPFHSEAAGDIQYCSACEIGFDAKTDYCPHCGAKMDGDGNADH